MSDLEQKRTDEGEDVEGHGAVGAPAEGDREKKADDGDDVEAHGGVPGPTPGPTP